MPKTTRTNNKKLERLVQTYFSLIQDLRKGDKSSVSRLMELWDTDGTFEFAGSPPVIGTFKGAAAIRTLYQNRVGSGDMQLSIETTTLKSQDVTLGTVHTEVDHLKTNGNRAVAAWHTTIGTTSNEGFDVAGSHLFVFEGDKIKSLRVTISPKPDQSRLQNLRLENLSVNDVGRLSLAAWPVV